jgi:hypothetical protein
MPGPETLKSPYPCHSTDDHIKYSQEQHETKKDSVTLIRLRSRNDATMQACKLRSKSMIRCSP